MSELKIAFMLANWYSGATLLTFLLNQNESVLSNGEGFYHKNQDGQGGPICSCNVKIKDCLFYREAAASMWAVDDYDRAFFAVIPKFSRQPIFNRLLTSTRYPSRLRRTFIESFPGTREYYRSFVRKHIEFMQKALNISGAGVYLDGTKSLRRAEIFLSERDYCDSPLILLVRHPVTWCSSWIRVRGDRTNLVEAISIWKEYVRRSYLLHQRFPFAPFLIVRYEDLCTDYERELTKVETFMGIGHNRSCRPEKNHILGNVMRRSFDGVVRPPRKDVDNISSIERARILKECGSWMTELGYADE